MAILTVRFIGRTTKEPTAEELKALLARARGSVTWNLAHLESRLKPAERPYSQMLGELKRLLIEIDEALEKLSQGA